MCVLMVEREMPALPSWLGKDRPMPRELAMLPDGELATDWLHGDDEALRVLVDRHRSAVFGLALRLCGDRDRAEDLAQDAFLRAFSRLHQYNTQLPFRPWIFRILGRLYIDAFRRQHDYLDADPDPPPLPPGNPESDLFVQGVLAGLTPEHRAILVLREVAEFSYEDLARAFRIPLGTVRSRLAHARAAFKARYLSLSHEEVAQ